MEKKSKGANLAAPHDGTETPWDNKTHGREMYEKEYNCKLIQFNDLMNRPWDMDFAVKLKKLARYGNVDSMMLISRSSDDTGVRVNFFTFENVYSINVHWKEEMEDSYLGCVVSSRKPRPGETWTRGNDLPDGKYNDDTWNRILQGIISYEMKTLQL